MQFLFLNNNYWKDFEEGYKIEFKDIKKLNTHHKFKKNEICEEKGYNELDMMIASFQPNKKQYKIITDIVIPKEMEIFRRYKV